MRSSPLRVFLLLSVLASTCLSSHAVDPYGLDLHGQPIHQLAGPGTRVVVLIFAATDCPVCNLYVPEIARVNREFSSQGVRIWWVFPNSEDTASAIEKHNHEFAISEPAIIDNRQSLVQLAHVTITPEAAVFKVEGTDLREIYHGRIDDRYLSIGRQRPQPQQHDLEVAISSALAGKPIPKPWGSAVGCAIVSIQK